MDARASPFRYGSVVGPYERLVLRCAVPGHQLLGPSLMVSLSSLPVKRNGTW